MYKNKLNIAGALTTRYYNAYFIKWYKLQVC